MILLPLLHNIRSTYNVGAILRTAEGLGVMEVAFSGYTPCPVSHPGKLPHITEKEREAIAKTALGAEKILKCQFIDNLSAWFSKMRDLGYTIVGLENNLKTQSELERLVRLGEAGLSKKIGPRLILILGEEVSGIPQEVRKEVDYFLEIPMRGKKESFNVSVAAGIAFFELR